ncbi:MAG: hypothetical protein GXZ11_01415 [Tissierellia bacterium]|nr:hypothetical protein [Tissierellia bacterium]
MSKKRTIEDVLNRINGLFKSSEFDVIDEVEEPEEDLAIEEEANEEPEDELEKSEEEEEFVEEPEEEPEMAEEPEEDEEEIEEEFEDEEVEENAVEVDYEELLARVEETVMDKVEARLAELEAQIIDGFNAQTDAIETAYEKSQAAENDLKKALNINFGKLEKLVNPKVRKSVDDIQVIDKFQEKAPGIDSLSKSEKSSILTAEIIAGNTSITSNDVANVELGGEPSEAARRVLEKSLRK